jgi:GNAT superfamily N-acetyltransferase
MAEVFLRRLSRWQAESQASDFAGLYADVYREVSENEPYRREDFLRRFAEHVQQPEFDMIIASNPRLVGCAYGFRIDKDGSWWDRFTSVPAELAELTDIAATHELFIVAELMVLPEHRRHGVGGRLVDQLLTRVSAPVAVALVEPTAVRAQDAFRSWGWAKTGDMTPVGDAKPLEAWTLQRT